MFNYDSLIDTVQNFNKSLVEKFPINADVKKNLVDGIEIQTVLVKSFLVQSEKTYKQIANLYTSKA